MPREVSIEAYLVREMKKLRIACLKFKTPGRRHAPDRICLREWGYVFFVETKAPGKKPRPGQAREFARLRKFGFQVFVADTKEKVDQLVRRFEKCDSSNTM